MTQKTHLYKIRGYLPLCSRDQDPMGLYCSTVYSQPSLPRTFTISDPSLPQTIVLTTVLMCDCPIIFGLTTLENSFPQMFFLAIFKSEVMKQLEHSICSTRNPNLATLKINNYTQLLPYFDSFSQLQCISTQLHQYKSVRFFTC